MPDMGRELIERFRPSAARWTGLVGAVVVVVLAVALVAGDWRLPTVTAAAGMLLFALVLYVALVRPTLHAYADHLMVRNLVSDTHIPWHLITDAELRQTLRIYTRDRVVHSVAMGRTMRQQVRDDRSQAGGRASLFSSGRPSGQSDPPLPGAEYRSVQYGDFVVGRILDLAHRQRQASRGLERLGRRWAYAEIGLLVALAVAFVALVVFTR